MLTVRFGNGGVPLVEDLATLELNTNMYLAPDGAGGVVWRAVTYPNVEALPTAEVDTGKYLAPDGAGGLVWQDLDSDAVANASTVVGADVSDALDLLSSQISALTVGLKWKNPCKVRANGNINLAAPGAVINSVTMIAGDRVCCDQQTTVTQDGLYVWNGAAVAMTRTTDAAVGSDFVGATFLIQQGADEHKVFWCSNSPGVGVIGTDDITLVNIFYSSELIVQEMHKITAGEVTAGFFSLANIPVNTQSVMIFISDPAAGPLINKECVGATGVTPDFDIIAPDLTKVYFKNIAPGAGLSEVVVQDDVLTVIYHK